MSFFLFFLICFFLGLGGCVVLGWRKVVEGRVSEWGLVVFMRLMVNY